MRCRECSRCALYQEPGFLGRELCWCKRRGEWREGCKHGKRGKPGRATIDVYVTVDGVAAVNGCDADEG